MGIGSFALPPEAKAALAGVPGMLDDLKAIRSLLERLVELEEARGVVVVNNSLGSSS